MNYNLRKPTIAEAKAFGRSIGVTIRYSPDWREFTVIADRSNRDADYFTADVIDAMQTAYVMSRREAFKFDI